MDERIKTKVAELVEDFSECLKQEAEHLCKSGGIDISEYDLDYYVLPKILLTAAINRKKDVYAPRKRDWERDVHNLIHV